MKILQKIAYPTATLLTLIILTGIGASCNRAPSYRECRGAVWHTSYTIIYGSSGSKTPDLTDSITATFNRVERSLSPFLSSSVISQVNGSDLAQRVNDDVSKVFKASLEVYRRSHGRFDPTVGPLVDLWGFGRTERRDSMPRRQEIESALESVGFGECRLMGDTIFKKASSTQFNFSAITKGYGCDEIAAMMRRNGVDNYMIEIGGEIAVGGVSHRGNPWHIMIDSPIESDSIVVHQKLAVIELTDCGLATSGNYRNYRELGGRRRGHTIDPVTGYPVEGNVVSASVIASSAMLADAYATACMAMHPDSALVMIESLAATEAMLVVARADSVLVVRSTSGWPKPL